jgi:hypothetical protein
MVQDGSKDGKMFVFLSGGILRIAIFQWGLKYTRWVTT